MKSPIKLSCLTAMALAMAGAISVSAQTSLQPQIVLRPLTPGEISTYGLPEDTEISGGLANVGVGAAIYLESEMNLGFPGSNIVSVSWAVTNKATGAAVAVQASPLGTNVPIYEPSDRLVYQVVPGSRALLRLKSAGQYTVTASITTTTGTTNLTKTVTASTYMGINTCALCHSGGQVAENKVVPWETTGHAHHFEWGIDGVFGSHYSASCIKCHTVGYDTNTNAVNGGFDDVAAQLGWTFPTNLVASNWASMQSNYPSLANLANIQCENCHGPGYNHASLIGVTNDPAWPSIAVTLSSGDCAQCHDEPGNHIKVAEWDNSVHAITTRDPSGPGHEGCVGCHTAYGFVGRMDGWTTTNTTYMAINCQTCHEPHGQTLPSTNAPNVHIIRTLAAVTLMDGTVVTNAGEGQLCIQCHHARMAASSITASTKGSPYFGPHHGPQSDMLEGVNGFTYGESIPSSAHAHAVSNTCVTCHMQTVGKTDPDFLHVGGHTFRVGWDGDSTHPAEDLVAACQGCHGPAITDFNFPLQDYNGDGVIQGVQDEVQGLLNKLSTYLPPAGVVKTSLSISSSWTTPQLEAAYNWLFVNNDGSRGIHNTAYAVGLLKASIADLSGDANNDGLPDAWQTNYFGSINNPLAAPDAINNTNGVPNWMMYALGLNPTQSGVTVPGGVVWLDGSTLVNSGATNTVHIYTAAEVSFNTTSGDTYQIQGISALSGGWQNIGEPILGTGQPVSYLTPTRNDAQMFFRVITNP